MFVVCIVCCTGLNIDSIVRSFLSICRSHHALRTKRSARENGTCRDRAKISGEKVWKEVQMTFIRSILSFFPLFFSSMLLIASSTAKAANNKLLYYFPVPAQNQCRHWRHRAIVYGLRLWLVYGVRSTMSKQTTIAMKNTFRIKPTQTPATAIHTELKWR